MSDIKRIKEQHYIGDELFIDMEVDVINGEKLDTCIEIDGQFWIAGPQRIEFKDKLEALINEYLI